MWRFLGSSHLADAHDFILTGGIGSNILKLALYSRKLCFKSRNLVPLFCDHLAQILNLLVLMGNRCLNIMELFFVHNSVYTIKRTQQKQEMMLQNFKSTAPGFALALIIGGIATILNKKIGIPTSLLALFAGIALSFLYNLPKPQLRLGDSLPEAYVASEHIFKKGINFSSKFVLRFGVAFLGFRIVLDDVLALGWNTALMVFLGITSTVIIGIIAAKLLGLRKEFGALTGGAVSICGASAAMAITSILPDHKNKDRDLSLTIIAVTAFSTTAMVLYPFIGNMLNLNPMDMSLFLGGSIHDVAQTAGAGYSISPEVGDLAILTKMIRVAFLLPVVIGLMFYFKTKDESHKPKVPVPVFLFVFIAFIILNSLLPIPESITHNIGLMSRQALITAIVAIGLKTNIRDVLAVGIKPIILITIQTITMLAVVLTCIAYL